MNPHKSVCGIIVKTGGGYSEVVTGEELVWFISGTCVAPVWGTDS